MNEVSINQIPEFFYVFSPGIPIVDVISMFPHIAREQFFLSSPPDKHQGMQISIAHLLDTR